MRCTCRRCVVTGPRQASLRHMAAGWTRFKSSSRGLPPRSPDPAPVRATGLSSISSSGLPEAPLESRSWLPRSVVTATFDGPLPAEPVLTTPQDGDTPVIVLTRACGRGRVAPVTRGSDALAHGFPDGARTRRTGPLTPRSRDAPLGIRSAAVSRPAPNFTHSLWHRRRVDPAGPQILGTPAVLARRGRYWVVFLLLLSDSTRSLDTGTRRSWLSFTTLTHRSGPPVLGGPCRGRIDTGPGRVRQSPGGLLLAAFRSLACVVTTATRRAFGPRVIRTRIRPLAGAECAPNSNRGRTAGTVHT